MKAFNGARRRLSPEECEVYLEQVLASGGSISRQRLVDHAGRCRSSLYSEPFRRVNALLDEHIAGPDPEASMWVMELVRDRANRAPVNVAEEARLLESDNEKLTCEASQLRAALALHDQHDERRRMEVQRLRRDLDDAICALTGARKMIRQLRVQLADAEGGATPPDERDGISDEFSVDDQIDQSAAERCYPEPGTGNSDQTAAKVGRNSHARLHRGRALAQGAAPARLQELRRENETLKCDVRRLLIALKRHEEQEDARDAVRKSLQCRLASVRHDYEWALELAQGLRALLNEPDPTNGEAWQAATIVPDGPTIVAAIRNSRHHRQDARDAPLGCRARGAPRAWPPPPRA